MLVAILIILSDLDFCLALDLFPVFLLLLIGVSKHPCHNKVLYRMAASRGVDKKKVHRRCRYLKTHEYQRLLGLKSSKSKCAVEVQV